MKDPLVGFHHNVMFFQAAFRNVGRTDFASCFGATYRRFEALRRAAGVPVGVWREQARLLGSDLAHLPRNGPCEAPIYSTRVMWYPTSAELRRTFKMRFEGRVCADDVRCVTARLKPLGMDSGVYVVGQSAYRFEKNTENFKPLAGKREQVLQ